MKIFSLKDGFRAMGLEHFYGGKKSIWKLFLKSCFRVMVLEHFCGDEKYLWKVFLWKVFFELWVLGIFTPVKSTFEKFLRYKKTDSFNRFRYVISTSKIGFYHNNKNSSPTCTYMFKLYHVGYFQDFVVKKRKSFFEVFTFLFGTKNRFLELQ